MERYNILYENTREALSSVLPIILIVAVLCFFFIQVSSGLMLSFLIGAAMIVLGMGLFTLGSDLSMTHIGNLIGSGITKSRRMWMILAVSFTLGVAITVAEPDLQVLATNVPEIDTGMLILTVSVGVGLFLMLSMLRILFAIPLKWLLIAFYTLVFLVALLAEKSFLSVAFDSGGVTTGPMTVPFIMAMGVGVASIRSDKNAKSDGFGLVALCSIGPILAVLLLGFLYENSAQPYTLAIAEINGTVDMGLGYLKALPRYLGEVSLALLPIFVFFMLFQFLSLKLPKRPLLRILIGIAFTFAGLILFLTGVNVGFSPLGYVLGSSIAESTNRWMLIPLAMIMGWFIIAAEPAVHVLTSQVTELSAGAISEKSMRLTLSIAVACAMGLSVIRVLTRISILWFLLPGYVLALGLSFFVPQTFTAIAFDAGGVASGPLTATFMLPFAMGACDALGGSVMTDAFGLVAMVAMMPLITIQVMGVISAVKSRSESGLEPASPPEDEAVIELWEMV